MSSSNKFNKKINLSDSEDDMDFNKPKKNSKGATGATGPQYYPPAQLEHYDFDGNEIGIIDLDNDSNDSELVPLKKFISKNNNNKGYKPKPDEEEEDEPEEDNNYNEIVSVKEIKGSFSGKSSKPKKSIPKEFESSNVSKSNWNSSICVPDKLSGTQLNDKKKEFEGSNVPKANWIICIYCNKHHPISMHLPELTYCGHCWAWLNTDQLNLIDGKYTGTNTIDQVKNFLKVTYPLHATTCKLPECIYNKITLFAEKKKLHNDLCIELGFVKEVKEVKEKDIIQEYNIKKNKKNIKINYKLSSITI